MNQLPGASERRASLRTARQNSATSLIQALLLNPLEAASSLERDLDNGAAPGVILGLLDAAESLSLIRGLDLSSAIADVREQIARKISGW